MENRDRDRDRDTRPNGPNRSSSTEELDPRIHLELEKLNSSTDQINKLEKELEETNEEFRNLLSDRSRDLEKLMRKNATAIDKSRPYYTAKAEADNLHKKCLEMTMEFQRANDIHQEARKSVEQAENRYNIKESQFDGACQEVLNHLTIQVMEAEKNKSAKESQHREQSRKFFEVQEKVQELEKLLQKDIAKSRTYFEMKNSLNSTLNELKTRTMKLQDSLQEAKRAYSMALYNLEMISEEIHRKRNFFNAE